MINNSATKTTKKLKVEHLAHFNYLIKEYPNKPVWWVVARAIRNYEKMNGKRVI